MSGGLVSIVGPPATPLGARKEKAARYEIARLLDVANEGPEVLLRGYLCAERTPPRQLLTADNISRALNAEDSTRYLSRLSRKKYVVDPEPALLAIRQLLSQTRSWQARKIAASLVRSARKWSTKKTTLADQAVGPFIEITSLILEKAELNRGSRGLRKRRPEARFTELVKLGTKLAAKSEDTNAALLATNMLRVAQQERELGIELILDEDSEFETAVQTVHAHALEQLRLLATHGEALAFEEAAQLLLQFPLGRDKTRAALEALFRDRIRFHESLQKALSEIMGVREQESPRREVLVDKGEAVETTQLASALLRAWTAREDSPKAREAFEELQSVLSQFFGLRLRGEKGTIETYNHRLHEFAYGESPSTRVELLRPWVELEDRGRVTVIMKALVKAAD